MADADRRAREEMRRWLARWRVVNETQDALARSEPLADPGAALEKGLAMIDVAFQLRESSPDPAAADDASDERVRETWRRLRSQRR